MNLGEQFHESMTELARKQGEYIDERLRELHSQGYRYVLVRREQWVKEGDDLVTDFSILLTAHMEKPTQIFGDATLYDLSAIIPAPIARTKNE